MSDDFLNKFLPGDSPEMRVVRQTIYLANRPAAVALRQAILLTGETGREKAHTAEIAAAHRAWLEQTSEQRNWYLGIRGSGREDPPPMGRRASTQRRAAQARLVEGLT